MIQPLHYCALIGRGLQSDEIFSASCYVSSVKGISCLAFCWFYTSILYLSFHARKGPARSGCLPYTERINHRGGALLPQSLDIFLKERCLFDHNLRRKCPSWNILQVAQLPHHRRPAEVQQPRRQHVQGQTQPGGRQGQQDVRGQGGGNTVQGRELGKGDFIF